jgi:hypothetical protein
MVKEYKHDSAHPSRLSEWNTFEGPTQVISTEFIVRCLDLIGDNVISLLPRRGSWLVATPLIQGIDRHLYRMESVSFFSWLGLKKYASTDGPGFAQFNKKTTANLPTR